MKNGNVFIFLRLGYTLRHTVETADKLKAGSCEPRVGSIEDDATLSFNKRHDINDGVHVE